MTDAEALRELRLLLAAQLRRGRRDVNWNLVRDMLWDVRYVLEDGCSPLIELRIRHRKRRALMCCLPDERHG